MSTRNDYIEKAKAQLDRWDAKIDQAEAKLKEELWSALKKTLDELQD